MTGMNETLRLAELLCARLCHDLSGPLGALIGVLEVAREEQPDSERTANAAAAASDMTEEKAMDRLRTIGSPVIP